MRCVSLNCRILRACGSGFVNQSSLIPFFRTNPHRYFLTVVYLERVGRKRLQYGGFVVIGLLYILLGSAFDGLDKVMDMKLVCQYST